MYEYSLTQPLHSERFQYHTLINRYKLSIKYIPFLFNRVRANGNELNDINKVIKMRKKISQKNRNTPLRPESNKPILPMFKVNSRKPINELL